MKKFLQFFEENNGRLSSTRLFSFLIVLSFVFEYVSNIYYRTIFAPSNEMIIIVLGVLGIKVTQKHIEVQKKPKEVENKEVAEFPANG